MGRAHLIERSPRRNNLLWSLVADDPELLFPIDVSPSGNWVQLGCEGESPDQSRKQSARTERGSSRADLGRLRDMAYQGVWWMRKWQPRSPRRGTVPGVKQGFNR